MKELLGIKKILCEFLFQEEEKLLLATKIGKDLIKEF